MKLTKKACGTGRLLIPIAESGVTIHGLDSSEDMLAVLERKATSFNVEGVELHNQLMNEGYSFVFKASK